MKTSLVILLILLLTLIYLSRKTFLVVINDDDDDDKKRDRDRIIFYEGSRLRQRAKKKIYAGKKLDCNCNLLECNEDSDCNDKCLSMPRYNNKKCLNGLCVYIKDEKRPYCENNGQVTNYFTLGRMVIGCICDGDGKFIGRFCQIPNLMKRRASTSFKLAY